MFIVLYGIEDRLYSYPGMCYVSRYDICGQHLKFLRILVYPTRIGTFRTIALVWTEICCTIAYRAAL